MKNHAQIFLGKLLVINLFTGRVMMKLSKLLIVDYRFNEFEKFFVYD